MTINTNTQERRDYTLLVGLLMGTFVGAGLAMWCAPRSNSELRERLTDSADKMGNRASGRYPQGGARIRDMVDELAKKGQSVRSDVADPVQHSAHEAARVLTATRTDPVVMQPATPVARTE